jgi:hypothetical protein
VARVITMYQKYIEIYHILRDLTFFNSTAEISAMLYIHVLQVVMYYTLVNFKYWCIDSPKMAEFSRNM